MGDALPLERLDIDEEPPDRPVWVGYHRDLKRLVRLRAFVDHVRARTPKVL
jgi:DNA-binding transcriptional LysR family regulator